MADEESTAPSDYAVSREEFEKEHAAAGSEHTLPAEAEAAKPNPITAAMLLAAVNDSTGDASDDARY